MKKSFLLNGKFCCASLASALTMLLTFAFIRDPRVDTISNIGLDHRVLFFFLCLLLALATGQNMIYMFRRVDYRHRFMEVIVWILCAGIVVASLTTTKHSRAETFVHWGGALLYIAYLPLVLLWVGLWRVIKRGEKRLLIPIVIVHGINTLDIVYMAVSFVRDGPHVGKNGVMELIPMCLTLLALLMVNNTAWFTNQDKLKDI